MRGPVSLPPTETVTMSVGAGTVGFDVATGGVGPAFFTLGVRKSGSSMLNQAMAFAALRNGVVTVGMPDRFFRLGLRAHDLADLDLAPVLHPGNHYAGFRTLPPLLPGTQAFRTGRKVFLFRDPRDALVSQYFSDGWSHPLPEDLASLGDGRAAFEAKRAAARQTPIDDYVLAHARPMLRTLTEYAGLLDDSDCLCLRYEEVLFQKRRMMSKVLAHFDWSLAPGQIDLLMTRIDKLPEAEDKSRFLREALPGDHRDKLRPDTIAALDRVLLSVLVRYDV